MQQSGSRLRPSRRVTSEAGSVTIVAGAVVMIFVVLFLALGTFGGVALDHVRAVDVADAAALAGALGGRDAAAGIAAKNSATLVAWTDDGEEVEVVITTSKRVSARARAHHRDRAVPISFDIEVPLDELG